jgi:hypothetical protein
MGLESADSIDFMGDAVVIDLWGGRVFIVSFWINLRIRSILWGFGCNRLVGWAGFYCFILDQSADSIDFMGIRL